MRPGVDVVRWGVSELAPQAGIAVYVRGRTGKLAAARIYDDAAPLEVSDSSQPTERASSTTE